MSAAAVQGAREPWIIIGDDEKKRKDTKIDLQEMWNNNEAIP